MVIGGEYPLARLRPGRFHKAHVVLTTVAPTQMVRHPRGLAFGGCVQSIEHYRRARGHSHQIRCGLSKPLADTGRPLFEGGIEARAKRRDRGFGAAMKLIVQTGGKCRVSACSSLRGSRLAPFAKYWSGRFMARARLERRFSGRSDFARNRSPHAVLCVALFNGPRGFRWCRLWRFAGEGHCRIRFSADPVIEVLRSTLLTSLENVMNSRRG